MVNKRKAVLLLTSLTLSALVVVSCDDEKNVAQSNRIFIQGWLGRTIGVKVVTGVRRPEYYVERFTIINSGDVQITFDSLDFHYNGTLVGSEYPSSEILYISNGRVTSRAAYNDEGQETSDNLDLVTIPAHGTVEFPGISLSCPHTTDERNSTMVTTRLLHGSRVIVAGAPIRLPVWSHLPTPDKLQEAGSQLIPGRGIAYVTFVGSFSELAKMR